MPPRRVVLMGLVLVVVLIAAASALGLYVPQRDSQVAVPPLPNTQSVSDATTVLEDAGLVVEVKGMPCGPAGYCKTGPVRTEPQEGSVVPSGSTVVLFVRGYGDET